MKKAEVNLDKINRVAEEKETIAVPGKVLGKGILKKKLTIAAESFSEKARKKIEKAGGKTMNLDDLEEKPSKIIK